MKVGVVGAGLMGSGIAQVSAIAGHDVVMRDVTDAATARGMGAINDSLARFVAKDRVTRADADAAIARISGTTDLALFAECDFVVEAVFEDLETKKAVFATLDGICRPDVVFATNTSAIPITSVATAVADPARVVGTHFFSPVPMMALCELVRGLKTSDATLARAREFAEGVGKTCVVVQRDVAGFVTTRLIVALMVEAARLVESGVASAADVDVACQLGFGHAMGPLRTLDLTGIDVIQHAAETIYRETGDTKFLPPELMARMVAAGTIGRKSGSGFYDY
jgi:3-hydroxybutyryl-CoA dehydrogenase